MAQNKKASEGIALLSMYGDEDDEMEEIDGEDQQPDQEELKQTPTSSERRRRKINVVDYGHDEVAMSPEHEEGEVSASGMLIDNDDAAVINGEPQDKMVHVQIHGDQTSHPQFAELNGEGAANTNNDINGSPSAMPEDSATATMEESKDVDLFKNFLPSPPKNKCSDELQRKIFRFIQLKKQKGRSFNAEVRNRKEYRNPDFLRHAVTYQDIDEIGSCFSKDVFDPHGYDKSDFYDELGRDFRLGSMVVHVEEPDDRSYCYVSNEYWKRSGSKRTEADMRRELERKEQERKRSPKVEFFSGGTQIGIPTPKINLPIPVIPGTGFSTTASAVDVITRDPRLNKKSKWDKVDGDRNTFLSAGGQDSVSNVSAQVAILSAANSGSGYSAYAEQRRRREAEDKRSSDRKSDRRS